jgi:quercetin 2,3-dioxygenase
MLATKPETSTKKLQRIQRSTERHWVGDGFPVRTLFGYSNPGAAISPFLLLDYAGPVEFQPTMVCTGFLTTRKW